MSTSSDGWPPKSRALSTLSFWKPTSQAMAGCSDTSRGMVLTRPTTLGWKSLRPLVWRPLLTWPRPTPTYACVRLEAHQWKRAMDRLCSLALCRMLCRGMPRMYRRRTHRNARASGSAPRAMPTTDATFVTTPRCWGSTTLPRTTSFEMHTLATRTSNTCTGVACDTACRHGRETKRHREEPWPPAARPKRRDDRTSSLKSPKDI